MADKPEYVHSLEVLNHSASPAQIVGGRRRRPSAHYQQQQQEQEQQDGQSDDQRLQIDLTPAMTAGLRHHQQQQSKFENSRNHLKQLNRSKPLQVQNVSRQIDPTTRGQTKHSGPKPTQSHQEHTRILE